MNFDLVVNNGTVTDGTPACPFYIYQGIMTERQPA